MSSDSAVPIGKVLRNRESPPPDLSRGEGGRALFNDSHIRIVQAGCGRVRFSTVTPPSSAATRPKIVADAVCTGGVAWLPSRDQRFSGGFRTAAAPNADQGLLKP